MGPVPRKLAAQDNVQVKADPSALPPGKDVVGSVTTHLVMTPVTVTDRAGNIVNNLTPKDFRLTDNGKVQKIDEDVAIHPISMVIAVQANAEVEKMLPAVQKVGSAIQA